MLLVHDNELSIDRELDSLDKAIVGNIASATANNLGYTMATRTLFDSFEVGSELEKVEYKRLAPGMRVNLVNQQYALKSAESSLLILLAGNDRKSVNEVLDLLHEWMDVRYLHTHVFLPRTPLEREYPSYWRYWKCLPPAGRVGCFLGAWPMQALGERMSSLGTSDTLLRRIRHMQALEKTLSENGTQVLKFWLHLPRKEVKRQLQKAKRHPGSEPYIRQEDWKVYEDYEHTIRYAEKIVKETSTAVAPWHIVEATDKHFRNSYVAGKIISALDQLNQSSSNAAPIIDTNHQNISANGPLATVDLSKCLPKQEYKEQLKSLQAELNHLVIKARDHFSTVLVFEGWDAAGKGGAIRRITQALFAEDYRVIPIAAPSNEEKKYHYLWRFWNKLPRFGKVAIFDRSWYGRVLVERTEGFADQSEWQRAYYEINDFEDQLLAHNMVVCKFWLHIDPEEQIKRFKARENLPYKNHKITEDDYRNRDKWPTYELAANEMFQRTNTSAAPWHIIAANDKRWARVQVLKTLVESMKNKLHTCS